MFCSLHFNNLNTTARVTHTMRTSARLMQVFEFLQPVFHISFSLRTMKFRPLQRLQRGPMFDHRPHMFAFHVCLWAVQCDADV